MGVSGGVWECGKPERFSIISMPQSEGEKGEVTFSLRRRSRRSFAPPFPPRCGFSFWYFFFCEVVI